VENAQVAAERDRLIEEKTKWLQVQQAIKEEKAKLAKDLESKYSAAFVEFCVIKFLSA
jgi:hypothetical protein